MSKVLTASWGVTLLFIISFIISQGCSEKKNEAPRLSQSSAQSGVGISLGLFASDPLWNYQPLLQEIKSTGAHQVLLVIPLTQELQTSDTPRLAVAIDVIKRTIIQAKTLQLEVSLMPVIQLKQRRMDIWRGTLAPNTPSLWWSNYRVEIKRIAALSQRLGVVRLVIGSELCSLEEDGERWAEVIHMVRDRFTGIVTYSANWDHYDEIQFWSLLDEVSITAYFPVESMQSLALTWRKNLDEMERFAQSVTSGGRPLLITEYGYPALTSAMTKPWDETTRAQYAPQLQADLVVKSTQILIQESQNRDSIQGGFLWNWFGFGGTRDHGYTLRGREGQERLTELFRASRLSTN